LISRVMWGEKNHRKGNGAVKGRRNRTGKIKKGSITDEKVGT